MVNSKLKNIIVLKGMASNVVQEAIVILKPNIDLGKNNGIYKNKENNVLVDRKKSVVSEAEYIINNYIKEIESTTKKNKYRNIQKKYKISKILNVVLVIACIIGFI